MSAQLLETVNWYALHRHNLRRRLHIGEIPRRDRSSPSHPARSLEHWRFSGAWVLRSWGFLREVSHNEKSRFCQTNPFFINNHRPFAKKRTHLAPAIDLTCRGYT